MDGGPKPDAPVFGQSVAQFLQHSVGVLRSWKRNLPPEFAATNRQTAGVARLAQNYKETSRKQPGAAEEAGRALPS